MLVILVTVVLGITAGAPATVMAIITLALTLTADAVPGAAVFYTVAAVTFAVSKGRRDGEGTNREDGKSCKE